jgi:hypothetical protein
MDYGQHFSFVFGFAAAAAYVLAWANRSKYFPWVTMETHRLNLILQLVLSFLATLGISFTWDPVAHTLLIAGLSIKVISAGFAHWFQQFALQHGFTNLIQLGWTNPQADHARAQEKAAEPVAGPNTAVGHLGVILLAIGLVITTTVATTACIHKTNAAGQQVNASPYEKAVTYSAMLAQTNNTIWHGAEQAQSMALLSVEVTDRIGHTQQIIADDHERISRILALGPDIVRKDPQNLRTLIDDIQVNVNALIQGGGLGVKNPTSQQTFQNDAQALLNLSGLILANLQQAGVLK